MALAALIVVSIVALGALVVLDRQGKRAHAQLSEFASRIQHPDLVSHRAAQEWEPPAQEPSALDIPETEMAGRILNGDGPDDDLDPERPDARLH